MKYIHNDDKQSFPSVDQNYHLKLTTSSLEPTNQNSLKIPYVLEPTHNMFYVRVKFTTQCALPPCIYWIIENYYSF